ncbi:MAG: hypothetical protein IPJ81_04755 [Chitinophagaceae bacterium]|nr:hypothetical protein [Chitinophagaceae bacterium]
MPDVYQMKDNNMSSNPDTRSYFSKDVFTYISYAINDEKDTDTTQFKVQELAKGDTAFYSNGYFILNDVVRNPRNARYSFNENDKAMMADISFVSKDSMHFKAMPAILIDELGINRVDDTLYAQNMYVSFMGVIDMEKIKIGIKESDKIIDFVALKTYIFPYINLVWIGLIIMSLGITMSMINRIRLSTTQTVFALIFVAVALFYMFLLAN